jgi:hypothetical protein
LCRSGYKKKKLEEGGKEKIKRMNEKKQNKRKL